MVIREYPDFLSQRDEPWFMPIEMNHDSGTDASDTFRVCVNRCEDIEQVLDAHVL